MIHDRKFNMAACSTYHLAVRGIRFFCRVRDQLLMPAWPVNAVNENNNFTPQGDMRGNFKQLITVKSPIKVVKHNNITETYYNSSVWHWR